MPLTAPLEAVTFRMILFFTTRVAVPVPVTAIATAPDEELRELLTAAPIVLPMIFKAPGLTDAVLLLMTVKLPPANELNDWIRLLLMFNTPGAVEDKIRFVVGVPPAAIEQFCIVLLFMLCVTELTRAA